MAEQQLDLAEQRGLRGFLTAQRLSWRTFWSRRAPWRITLVKTFIVAALIIVAYLAAPSDAQAWVVQALLTAGRAIASLTVLGPTMLLTGIAALLVLLCLVLVFVRPYHRATYLATTPSAIPLISVYVDAENQLSNITAISKFADKVMEHLNGRRADLLFFMDASSQEHGAQTEQFKKLCRHGFRPVHVAHNPTGKARRGVKEAVDKELAMHAYERALLGPPNQEFIIVTADQDFVALVYRLAALGHHVQVWATPILPAYRELATYLDIELLDIARFVSDEGSSSQEGSEAGEKQLYRAIMETLRARDECEERHNLPGQRLSAFRGILNGKLATRLAGVGYRAMSKVEYWLDHLYATGVLIQKQADNLPDVGATTPENAAHALFVVAQLTADVAIAIGEKRADGVITMNDIANALLPERAQVRSTVRRLLNLIAQSNTKRAAHARYFVHCAQALGLVEFDEVPKSANAIRSPRVGTPLSDDLDGSGDAEAGTDADTSTPTDDAETDGPDAPPVSA